ncbi:MAG: 2-phospho-L-lactate guanylyltransferase [Actinobacteria bacterium]|nr:2-phospho-L-lactate guanylyltransferase [Actinomycetota bacterium]
MTAIIPLKALDHSKQRLAPRLAADERRALMATLFTHVARVCADSPAIASIVAVVGDDAGAALARDVGVASMRERGGGLNAALRQATTEVDDDASLIVVADLPRLTGTDLDRMVGAGGPVPCVVVAPTQDGGTGALLRRPPDVIAPAFGPASAAAHLTAARSAGVRAALLATAGLAHDVDRPADLGSPPAGGNDHRPHL